MSDRIPDHRPVIVAGLGRLGLRIVQALRGHGVPVRVITDAGVPPWHLQKARDAEVKVFTGDFRDPEVWRIAGAEECQAAVVTTSDDSKNLETSIRVKRLAPALRMVTRVDAPHLGHRLQHDFELHAALCPAVLSASHFVKCALDASIHSDAPAGRRPALVRGRASWQLFVLVMLVTCLVAGTMVFHFAMGLPWMHATYFTVTILTTVGFGDYHLQNESPWLQGFGMILMLSGFSLIALMVSLFSHFLMTGEATRAQHDRAARRRRHHVIVAGMGSLGHAVVRDLHERGVQVVCVEIENGAAGVAAATHHVPVIAGDATEAETLLRAGIDRARAIMAVTSADGVNLEIALRARTLAEQHRPGATLPVIIACQDELLAARLRNASNSYFPLSSAEIAAPVFAESAVGIVHGGRKSENPIAA